MNRKPFWIAYLSLMVCMSVLALVILLGFGLPLGPINPDKPISFGNPNLMRIVIIAASLVFIWPALAIVCKRLHDRDRRLWFYLLMLVPFVNWWVVAEISILRGTQGENRFGPDPLGAQPGLEN